MREISIKWTCNIPAAIDVITGNLDQVTRTHLGRRPCINVLCVEVFRRIDSLDIGEHNVLDNTYQSLLSIRYRERELGRKKSCCNYIATSRESGVEQT